MTTRNNSSSSDVKCANAADSIKKLTLAALQVDGSANEVADAMHILANGALEKENGGEAVQSAISALSTVAIENAQDELASTSKKVVVEEDGQLKIPEVTKELSYTENIRLKLTKEKTLLNAPHILMPIKYEYAWNAFIAQNRAHWTHEEINLSYDAIDWKNKLTAQEQLFNEHIFRNFTQFDVVVFDAYTRAYFKYIQPLENRMAAMTFGAIECVHIAAYEQPIPVFGLPEKETLEGFLEYDESVKKFDSYEEYVKDTDTVEGFAIALAFISGCVEGVMLNGSFAALMRPAYAKGVLMGVSQIAAYSSRDENIHTDTGCLTYKILIEENPHLRTEKTDKRLREAFRATIEQEDAFMGLCFSIMPDQTYMGMTLDQVKAYLRMLADRRMEQLGLMPMYHVGHNPLPWIDYVMNGLEHSNFFEQKATEYAKGATSGTWDDAFPSNQGADLFTKDGLSPNADPEEIAREIENALSKKK